MVGEEIVKLDRTKVTPVSGLLFWMAKIGRTESSGLVASPKEVQFEKWTSSSKR